MRRTSKSAKRTPAAKAAGSTGNASKDVTEAAVKDTSPASAGITVETPVPAETSGAKAGGSPVWRSTRLRSGHASKIDYLKLHNTNTGAATAARESPAASLLTGGGSHKKRPAAQAATPAALAIEKRPRLFDTPSAQSPGASSYTCPVCSTLTTSSRAFDQHMLANHSDVQPFACVFCDLHMRTTKALQHHYVRQHRVYAPVPDCLHWRLAMQCRACGQSFHTAEHLLRHMDWAHTRCSSIVLMEKLPDGWGWSRDRRTILESADAVEEEYDLAFPGRKLFYSGHPGMLESDMSIRLQPVAPVPFSGGTPGAAAGRSGDIDVYAFEDDDAMAIGGGDGDIEIDVMPTPSKDAGVFGAGRGRRKRQLLPRRPAMEIDFEQLLQRGATDDNEIDPDASPEQQPLKQRQPRKQRRSRQPQPQPFASETPHYVSSRAIMPASHQSFPCPICMTDMATLKSRDRHLLQRHPGVRAFACLECDCTYETYIALRSHVRAEHPAAESGAYKLLIAPGLRRRAGQRAATTASSVVAAGSLKPFLCTVCGVSFDLVHQLSAHYATAHEGVRGIGGRQQRAGSSGAHRGAAALHESGAGVVEIDFDALTSGKSDANGSGGGVDDLKLTCELCSAQFDKITALECHIASDHLDETPYECHLCPAYFPSFGRLRHHQRTVHRVFLQWKEPPQAVLTKLRARSPATSATVLNLAVPLRRSDMAKVAHQQLKFFDPQSAANISLESVVSGMTATDTVIFCDFCGDACHNKLELGRHLQSHSGKRLRFGCSKCGQVFEGWNAKSDLVDHMKVDHMGKARYRCNQCEAQFKYSSLLKLHKERGCNSNKPLARPVISYGCSSCDKIFCGELSAERYRQHTQQCSGQLSRALPSSAAVQPPPTAVISGLDGVEASGDEAAVGGDGDSVGIETTSAAASLGGGGGGGAGRVVQMTLPGSKEPVSVLIHLEGPLSTEALNQAFVVQSAAFGGHESASDAAAAAAAAAAADAEPLQSLAEAAAAASASSEA